MYGRAKVYQEEHEYDLAIQDYDQLLQIKPDSVDALNGRGFAYAQQGDDHNAIRDYDQTLRISPNYSAAFYNRSQAYARKGQFLRAVADRSRFFWLKFESLGITIRVFFVLSVGFGVALCFKRFRKTFDLRTS
ncbi:MAG: tetratricopeptide repeat protein [Candidatus Acidiferrum sp.]